MEMIKRVGAQGDLFFERVAALPDGVAESIPADGRHVLAHSETGHHHFTASDGVVRFDVPSDPLTCYLRVGGDFADIEHARDVFPHQTIRLMPGLWRVRRQREYVPGGFRRVED